MSVHVCETEKAPSGRWWGECGCGNWSGGPCSTERAVVSQHESHLHAVLDERETSIGWPEWDRPDEWGDE